MYRHTSDDLDGEDASDWADEHEPSEENQQKRPRQRRKDDASCKEEGPA